MAKLTHLFLDHNSLQDFSSAAVLLSPKLTHLDLGYNQLRVLQPLALGSPKLTRLNLAGNPIYCSCYLRPLREWSIQGRVRLGGTCSGPPHLSDESLDAVQPPDLRCQSQEAMLKFEQEERSRLPPPPTTPPGEKAKCPDNCVCEVRENSYSMIRIFFMLGTLLIIKSCLCFTLNPRLKTIMHPVKSRDTLKYHEAFRQTYVCWTCMTITSITLLPTVFRACQKWCPFICSAVKSMKWKVGPSVV